MPKGYPGRVDRKIYDNKRSSHLYSEFRRRKDEIHEILGGSCALCKTSKASHGWHLHHLYYDPVESNYPKNSKSMSTRWKRLIEAENHPERFLLLCVHCHRIVEALKSLVDSGCNINFLQDILDKSNRS